MIRHLGRRLVGGRVMRGLVLATVLTMMLAATNTEARVPDSGASISLMGIDLNPEGNSATLLGPLERCRRAAVGSLVFADITVDSIPPDRRLIAFQYTLYYDPSVLRVVAVDNDQLLAAEGDYWPFIHPHLNDLLPDSDGSFNVGVVDLASNEDDIPGANTESGPGVLSRVTFEVVGPGRTKVSVHLDETYPSAPRYPAFIIDVSNTEIPIDKSPDSQIITNVTSDESSFNSSACRAPRRFAADH